MNVDSLDELTAAFDRWRSNKRHVREQVPKELWERAIRSIQVHGLVGVARATKLDTRRLVRKQNKSNSSATVPTFSRLEIPAPSTTSPLAEVETATGVKLRVFAQTPEILGLLSSLCGLGGA